uniref:WAP domain-containing protein n=1 Tax=Arcella intermedia TaxID=1963864 RepID=A0A6B2L3C3_9EUKA
MSANLLCDSSCSWQWGPCEKPGLCPVFDGFGTCDQKCDEDSSCPGAQRCCSNGCGHACMDVLQTDPKVCTFADCPGVIGVSIQVCPDGSTAGPVCERSPSGTCQWDQTTCPQDPVVHEGACPQILCGGFAPDTCSSDSNCTLSQKCCFSGCRKECMEAVKECHVAGTICYDPPLNMMPVALNESPECLACLNNNYCYRENANASCSWTPGFIDCMVSCTTTKPVKECKARDPCGCQALFGCGWCDVSNYVLVGDMGIPYSYGICMSSSLVNKCSAPLVSFGFNGNYVDSISTCEMISNASEALPAYGTAEVALSLGLNPNLVDGSSLATGILRIVMQRINEGVISEVDLQTQLDTILNYQSSRVVVKNILQALLISESQTKVQTVIEVYNIMNPDVRQICDSLHRAYANVLGFDVKYFKVCGLAPVMGLSVKRQTGSYSTYIHTSTLTQGNTNTGRHLSLGLLILLCSIFLSLI